MAGALLVPGLWVCDTRGAGLHLSLVRGELLCGQPVPTLQVAPIVDAVRTRGDEAVREYTQRFDRTDVSTPCVPIQVQALAWLLTDTDTKAACSQAELIRLEPHHSRTAVTHGTANKPD